MDNLERELLRSRNTLLSSESRKGFLISLGAASLAACSSSIGSSLKPLSTDILCGPPTCKGGGGGYNSTGGVNPNAWQQFLQFNGYAKVSNGYTNNSNTYGTAAFGSNSLSNGSLLHTATFSAQETSGGGVSISTSVQPAAYTQNTYQGDGVIPSTIPENGTFQLGNLTVQTSSNAYGPVLSTKLNIQGTPCTITLSQSDATGQTFTLVYKNTQSGATALWTYTLPAEQTQSKVKFIRVNWCAVAAVSSAALFVFGVALGAALLPEAAAVGAAYAALGGVASGAQFVSGVIGVLTVPACA